MTNNSKKTKNRTERETKQWSYFTYVVHTHRTSQTRYMNQSNKNDRHTELGKHKLASSQQTNAYRQHTKINHKSLQARTWTATLRVHATCTVLWSTHGVNLRENSQCTCVAQHWLKSPILIPTQFSCCMVTSLIPRLLPGFLSRTVQYVTAWEWG